MSKRANSIESPRPTLRAFATERGLEAAAKLLRTETDGAAEIPIYRTTVRLGSQEIVIETPSVAPPRSDAGTLGLGALAYLTFCASRMAGTSEDEYASSKAPAGQKRAYRKHFREVMSAWDALSGLLGEKATAVLLESVDYDALD